MSDVVNTEKIKKKALSEESADSSPQSENNHEVINPDDLDVLYKKNAHLLARLSKTGRENTQLYMKLSSLNKEKSQLGDRNTVLKNKFLDMKGQISQFARQHRNFSYQSQQLKEELQKVQEIRTQDAPVVKASQETLKKREKELHFFTKKEQVYTNQIKNLQNLCRKKEAEKQKELQSLKSEQEERRSSLENKIRELYQALSVEKEKAHFQSSTQIKRMKISQKELNQKLKELARENQQFKNREEQILKRAEKNKEEKEEIEVRLIKQESEKAQILSEDLLKYKNRVSELTREKEQLKSSFTEQIHLFSKERDLLKFECENLQKALSVGQEGFDQAMLSFQKRYKQVYKEHKDLKVQIEGKNRQIQSLKKEIECLKSEFQSYREEVEGQIRREKDIHINQLRGELKASKEYVQGLENQMQTIRNQSQSSFLKEKKMMEEEIQNLKWNQDKSHQRIEESYKKDTENLKIEYENRIQNMESGVKRKYDHMITEIENDLCSEKKRHEIFKSMKEKQVKEMESNLSVLQEQNHQLQTRKFVLEKSLQETKESLERYLKNSIQWEERNENLRSLWEDLQKQNESKDQQIRSLQKLNRSLSESLNQSRKKANFKATVPTVPSPPEKEEEEVKKPIPHILADIHFD